MKGQCARFTQSHQSHSFSTGKSRSNPLRGGTIICLTRFTLALVLALPIALPVLTPLEAQASTRQYSGRRVPGGKRDICRPETASPKNASPKPVSPKPSHLAQPLSPGESPQPIPTTSALSFTALIREVDLTEGAKTTAANPIVWVYVPYSSQDQHRQLWLSLDEQDEKGKVISTKFERRSVKLPQNPGIMPIALPADTTLDVNKTYRWSLQTTCFHDRPKSPPPIQFSITRVPESAKNLKSADQRDRLAMDGIWLDALMVGMQNQRPGNLSADFKLFLERHLIGNDLAQEADRVLPLQEKESLPSDQWAIAYLQKVIAQPLVR